MNLLVLVRGGCDEGLVVVAMEGLDLYRFWWWWRWSYGGVDGGVWIFIGFVGGGDGYLVVFGS